MTHAREEYLFQYSIYVLESCTSRRLTYFLPPTNLLPLLFLRPLRLFLPSDTVRGMRIILLRSVSIPFVVLIWCYEGSCRLLSRDDHQRPFMRMRTRPLSTRNLSQGLLRYDNSGKASALRGIDPQSDHRLTNSSGYGNSNLIESTELIALVHKLSAQIDDLKSLVAAQKRD